jgi:hypothetical protein
VNIPQSFVKRIHNISIGPKTPNGLLIGIIAEVLAYGFTVRFGRHGLEVDGPVARLWVAPELETGNRSIDIFTEHARCVCTVSILNDDAEPDYRTIAGHFLKTWQLDSDTLRAGV